MKTAESRKAKLEAAVGKAAGDIEAAAAKVGELAASIATGDADLESARKVCDKEASDCAAKEAEIADVVDTLGRAIGLLESGMARNPASFAQMGTTTSVDGLVKSLSAIVGAASFSSAAKQNLLSMAQARQGAASENEEPACPSRTA